YVTTLITQANKSYTCNDPHSNSLRFITFFFTFTIQPPPTSTLFPYTTLFRSRGGGGGRAPARHARGVPRRAGRPLRARPGRAGGDRKSTRLNSSHRTISYAVFCLKKKKKLEFLLTHVGHVSTRRAHDSCCICN